MAADGLRSTSSAERQEHDELIPDLVRRHVLGDEQDVIDGRTDRLLVGRDNEESQTPSFRRNRRHPVSESRTPSFRRGIQTPTFRAGISGCLATPWPWSRPTSERAYLNRQSRSR